MIKVLLVIPEKSYKSNDFVIAAKKLKIPFSIITNSEQVSEQFSNNIINTNFTEDISNEVLGKLNEITHVLPVDHSSVEYAAKLRDLLNATGNSYSSVNIAMDKYKSRMIFNDVTDVKINNDYVNDISDLNTFMSRTKTGILKPTKGTASNKVIKITDENMNQPSIHNIIEDCNEGELIIEEFVHGDEYAYEGMLIDSELSNFAVFEKPLVYEEPYFEESIYLTPSILSNEVIKKVQIKLQEACIKIGLTNGPIHAEFKITNDQVFIIEINPRMIGGLCSRCLSFGLFKQSLEELILASFSTGNFKQIELLSKYVGVLMLPVPKSGKFISINEDEIIEIENITSVDITVSKNTVLKMPPNGDKYLGFVFSQGEQKSSVINALKKSLEISRPLIQG